MYILLEGLNRFHSANLTLSSDVQVKWPRLLSVLGPEYVVVDH